MFKPIGGFQNAKRMLRRIGPMPDSTGSIDPVRASKPATLRLRCTSDRCGKVHRAADRQRCPYCQHPTVIVGVVA